MTTFQTGDRVRRAKGTQEGTIRYRMPYVEDAYKVAWDDGSSSESMLGKWLVLIGRRVAAVYKLQVPPEPEHVTRVRPVGDDIADRLYQLGAQVRRMWLAEEDSTEAMALGRRIEDMSDEVRAALVPPEPPEHSRVRVVGGANEYVRLPDGTWRRVADGRLFDWEGVLRLHKYAGVEPVSDVAPDLLSALRDLGYTYGQLGVAKVAVSLTDPAAVSRDDTASTPEPVPAEPESEFDAAKRYFEERPEEPETALAQHEEASRHAAVIVRKVLADEPASPRPDIGTVLRELREELRGDRVQARDELAGGRVDGITAAMHRVEQLIAHHPRRSGSDA